MCQARFSSVIVGLACLGIGYAATVVAQSGDAAAQRTKVGVVDIGILFKDYKRKDDLEAQINTERERMKEEIERDQEEIRKLRDTLDNGPFVRGSDPWLLEADKIKLAQHSLEYKERRLQAALKKRVEEFTLQVLSELEGTIGRYGRHHGYTLILKVDNAAPEAVQGELAAQFQERIFRAQISDVLFHDKAVDLTPAVLQLLNSDANIRHWQQQAQKQASRPRSTAPEKGGN